MIDSSAIVAILFLEPNADRLMVRIDAEPGCLISAANYVETGQVLARRYARAPSRGVDRLHGFMDAAGIEIAPIDEAQARAALVARIRYGRGFGHRAHLNYSDCFAYALAKSRNLPLLFIGDDFTHTDVVSAMA